MRVDWSLQERFYELKLCNIKPCQTEGIFRRLKMQLLIINVVGPFSMWEVLNALCDSVLKVKIRKAIHVFVQVNYQVVGGCSLRYNLNR